MKRLQRLKGETLTLNGEAWTVVDVAPAAPLAEMVAVILEDEGFVVTVRGADLIGDVFSHLGASDTLGTTLVLVPAGDAERALQLIAETVTDYEGDELDAALEALAAEGGAAFGAADPTDPEDPEDPDEPDDPEGGGGPPLRS